MQGLADEEGVSINDSFDDEGGEMEQMDDAEQQERERERRQAVDAQVCGDNE